MNGKTYGAEDRPQFDRCRRNGDHVYCYQNKGEGIKIAAMMGLSNNEDHSTIAVICSGGEKFAVRITWRIFSRWRALKPEHFSRVKFEGFLCILHAETILDEIKSKVFGGV